MQHFSLKQQCLCLSRLWQVLSRWVQSCTTSDHLTLRPCTTQVFPLSFPPGRGRASHAYTHSVQVDHHVFLNLHTLKVTAPSLICLAPHHSAFLHTSSPLSSHLHLPSLPFPLCSSHSLPSPPFTAHCTAFSASFPTVLLPP